jgi:hypothetical protein
LGSAGLQAGYYYWNGANWATIATAALAGNAVVASDLVKLYSEAHSKASGKIGNSSTGFVFTVPVSGRYLFDFTSGATALNGGTNTIYFTVRQGSNVLATDMQSSYNNNVHVEYNGKVEVNLQAGVSYNVYNYATSGSFETNDFDRVYFKMVAGNLPVNQHIASANIQLNNNYLSNDGGNEGIRIDNSGKVGIGTTAPSTSLHIENGNTFGTDPAVTTSPSLYVYNTNNASTTAHATATIRTNGSGGGNPYLSFDINGIRGYSMGIDNADGDKFKFHSNWSLNNANTPVLTITSDNRVGIGTTTPAVPLHVSSSVTQYVNVYGYLNQNTAQGNYTANTNVNYSIQTDGRIRAPEFNAISDVRIKKDILKLNTVNTLSELNKLRPVNYAYIDQLFNGNKQKTGFIAQEVEQVNPQFVNQSTDFIPSVFALAKSASVDKDQLMLTTEKPHGFTSGDVVKFFAEGKKEVISTIETIIDSYAFTITGWREPVKNLFVYGKKVTDFRAIDFDQITALSVAAIQELSKQVEKLKLENEKLELNQKKLDQRMKKIETKLK